MTLEATVLAHPSPYWYQARHVKTIDGDTVELEIDVGFRLTTRLRVRVLGIDTPELRSRDPEERTAATAAKLAAHRWFIDASYPTVEWPLIVRTEKADSFGRWLADIRASWNGERLADHLLDTGHAKPYER